MDTSGSAGKTPVDRFTELTELLDENLLILGPPAGWEVEDHDEAEAYEAEEVSVFRTRSETYSKITFPIMKHVQCRECGRRFRRSKTFWQTANPYNLGETGVPKTVGEIMTELRAEAVAWEPEDLCTKCKDAGDPEAA